MLPLILLGCAAPSPPGTPTAWLPDVDHPQWVDERVEGLATAWRFEALLPTAEAAQVTCTLEGDPEEVHTVAAPAHRLPDLVLYGLLAESTYTCALSAGGVTETRVIMTPALPDWLPEWELTVPGDAGGAYTLLNHGTDLDGDRQSKLLVVDADGRLRWYLDVPYEAPDLDAQYLGAGEILYGGGYHAPPTRIDLGGVVLSEAELAGAYHHHVEALETGQVLTLRESRTQGGGDRWLGFSIEVLDPAMRVSTWTWDSQRGVDEGWLPLPPDPAEDDPHHANALVWTDDSVIVNLYEIGRMAKLDRVTGERQWTLGPDQDFVLLEADGAVAADAEWFWKAHAPEVDGDRVLLYDNGRDRPDGSSWSRVLELELDEEARTARKVWEYREPGWYEPIWGDVDRLASGNVLVVRAHCGHCIGSDDQRTEILEVEPLTGAVVWRMTFADEHDAGYRAARIDGCAIFSNAKYCY